MLLWQLLIVTQQPKTQFFKYFFLSFSFFSSKKLTTSASQESIGTRSAPVGDVSTPAKSIVNRTASPAKSTERLTAEDQKSAKLKSPALSNIASEQTSTMSPPPAKRLALSAKKVSALHLSLLSHSQMFRVAVGLAWLG